MRNLLKALALVAFVSPAFGADLPRAQAPAAPSNPCTTTTCTGFYGGFDLTGAGSDIANLNPNVFAGGGGLGLDAGYQYWDSKFYFAANVFGDYMFQNFSGTTTTPGNSPGPLFGEFVDLGMPLGGLFGTFTPASGFPSALAASSLTPYIKVGALERPGLGAAWAVGGGMAFDISTKWFLKLDYIHGTYANSSTDNLIRVGLNYKFNY